MLLAILPSDATRITLPWSTAAANDSIAPQSLVDDEIVYVDII